MGLFKVIFGILGLLILALVGLGAFLYFTDYEAEATITERGRDAEGSYVVVRPKMLPYEHKQTIDANAARFVCEDYTVKFRIQSQKFQVYDPRGTLVYTSDGGLAADPVTLTQCEDPLL